MCDPVTLLAVGATIFGATQSNDAPDAVIPATPVQDAKEDTDAEVVLNSDLDDEVVVEEEEKKKLTEGSGLNTANTQTGISIL